MIDRFFDTVTTLTPIAVLCYVVGGLFQAPLFILVAVTLTIPIFIATAAAFLWQILTFMSEIKK